jgi:hypothetical protein
MSAAIANSPVLWALLLTTMVAIYPLPVITAIIRHVNSIATVPALEPHAVGAC